MLNVSAQSSRLRRRACQFLISSALLAPGAAWADCTPANAPSGSTITCDQNSASYSDLNNSLTVIADAGTSSTPTVVVAPLVIGSGTVAAPSTLTVASAATIEGTAAQPTVQFGDYAQITNNGTITASSSSAGAAAIQVGVNSIVTNNGTLTAAAGTPAVTFTATGTNSTNGTFNNGATATAAVTGNIVFGNNSGANVGTFNNAYNTSTTSTSTATYGLDGNVSGSGNLAIDNEGQWTGSLVQSAYQGGTVTFTNGVNASFNGSIVTGDTTVLINNATGTNPAGIANAMLLGNGSVLGSNGAAGTSLTNNGTLSIGSTVAPGLLTINGAFTQTSAGILNMAVAASGTVSAGASSQPYSQIYAAGGTAALAGTLNLNVTAGFYPAGSTYQIVVADKGITGAFSTVNVLNANSLTLPFITFVNLGTVTTNASGQQAYEFQVQRVGTYASVIAPVATPNEIAVANGLQPLVAVATANTASQEATLIGQIDQLTLPQATALFDDLSPAAYLNYATALRDQANDFERQIQLRMTDQNSDHAEDGFWGNFNVQENLHSPTVDTSKGSIFGFNGGYDLSGPHHVFGLAGDISFDSMHNTGAESGSGASLTGKNRDLAIAGYGGYDLGPIHLTGQVAYNLGHLSTNRYLTFSTSTATATGSASEHLFKATATAGFQLKTGGYTLEPFGGIDFNRGQVNSFTEQGDGAAAMTVLPISANRTDLLAGLNVTRSHGKFRPYLRATYRSEIGHENSLVSAFYDADTNGAPEFTVVGTPAGRHEGDVNAGINWVFEDAGSLFVGYQGTIRSDYNAQGINLGIRLEF